MRFDNTQGRHLNQELQLHLPCSNSSSHRTMTWIGNEGTEHSYRPSRDGVRVLRQTCLHLQFGLEFESFLTQPFEHKNNACCCGNGCIEHTLLSSHHHDMHHNVNMDMVNALNADIHNGHRLLLSNSNQTLR